MKRRSLLLSILSIFLLLPYVNFAGSHEDGEKHEHTALEDEMDAMNKAWRKVRRQVADPSKNEDTVKLVMSMVKHAEASVELTPMRVEEVADADRDKWLKGYQKAMKENVKLLEQLAAALKKDNNEKASALVAKINDARKEGHKKYKPQDD